MKTKKNDTHKKNLFSLFTPDSVNIPITKIYQLFQKQMGNTNPINKIISNALKTGQIDKVLDYDKLTPRLQALRRSWHLKRLTTQEPQDRLQLQPIKFAILETLWQQNHPKFLGEIPIEELRATQNARVFRGRDSICNIVRWRVNTSILDT